MTLLDVVVVALVQGLAEVFPLGASGHLALLPGLAARPEGRAALLAAAEIGIAAALALYFWRDMMAMTVGLVRLSKGRLDAGGRLLLLVIAGTLPALAVGWGFLELGGGSVGRLGAATALALFGLFLLIADRLGVTVRRIEHMSWGGAAAIGLLQAAALIPGVSRTGITITAARLMGYERQDAARFSLLLAIPLVAAHAAFIMAGLSRQASLIWSADLALAAGLSFAAALLAAAILVAWLDRHTLAPFAMWRIVVGGAVLVFSLLP